MDIVSKEKSSCLATCQSQLMRSPLRTETPSLDNNNIEKGPAMPSGNQTLQIMVWLCTSLKTPNKPKPFGTVFKKFFSVSSFPPLPNQSLSFFFILIIMPFVYLLPITHTSLFLLFMPVSAHVTLSPSLYSGSSVLCTF